MYRTWRCTCCRSTANYSNISHYCTMCLGAFWAYIKPAIRAAKRQLRQSGTPGRQFKDIKMCCNGREVCLELSEGDENLRMEIIDMMLLMTGLDNEDNDFTVTSWHMDIQFDHCDDEETYFGVIHTCYFNLYGCHDTLYRAALFSTLRQHCGDITRLHGGIIDDLCAFEPIFAVRFLTPDV
ncbi:hypothetical protein F-M6_0280 [Faustovirus]|nr:hypothetical protein F-M6_0280 [Faustovirus]SMH63540.1 Hypothetical protein FSTVLC9_58 [Faustovirus]